MIGKNSKGMVVVYVNVPSEVDGPSEASTSIDSSSIIMMAPKRSRLSFTSDQIVEVPLLRSEVSMGWE